MLLVREYNSQAFTPDEVEKGLHLDLIKFLLEQSSKFEDSYYEIHIDSDGYCTIIEWYDKRYNGADGDEGWKFVDYEHEVMYRQKFPDNCYEYFPDKECAEEALQEWLKDNPGWKKNQYGHWYNEKENEDFYNQFVKPFIPDNPNKSTIDFMLKNELGVSNDDYEIPIKEDQDDYEGKCDVNND